MANKKDKHKNTHDNINANLFLIWFAILGLFICIGVFRFEIDNLVEENEFLKMGNDFINFSVICEGNGVIAKANYSLNDYDLYKEMMDIYNNKNCDVLVSEGEQDGK